MKSDTKLFITAMILVVIILATITSCGTKTKTKTSSEKEEKLKVEAKSQDSTFVINQTIDKIVDEKLSELKEMNRTDETEMVTVVEIEETIENVSGSELKIQTPDGNTIVSGDGVFRRKSVTTTSKINRSLLNETNREISEKAQKVIDEYNSDTQFKAVAIEVAREVSQKQVEETKVVERSDWRFWFWMIIIILIIAIVLRFVSKKWLAIQFPFLTRFKRFSEFKKESI